MIFLLPFSWRVRIYQWRARREEAQRIRKRGWMTNREVESAVPSYWGGVA